MYKEKGKDTNGKQNVIPDLIRDPVLTNQWTSHQVRGGRIKEERIERVAEQVKSLQGRCRFGNPPQAGKNREAIRRLSRHCVPHNDHPICEDIVSMQP